MSGAPFTLYYDGSCHLCRREARWLARVDAGRGRLGLVDIADPAFDPSALGLGLDDLRARIHGRTPGGEVVSGVEVFRRAYRALGYGWVMSWTGWPGVRWVVDAFYRWFARNRIPISRCVGACVPRSGRGGERARALEGP